MCLQQFLCSNYPLSSKVQQLRKTAFLFQVSSFFIVYTFKLLSNKHLESIGRRWTSTSTHGWLRALARRIPFTRKQWNKEKTFTMLRSSRNSYYSMRLEKCFRNIPGFVATKVKVRLKCASLEATIFQWNCETTYYVKSVICFFRWNLTRNVSEIVKLVARFLQANL